MTVQGAPVAPANSPGSSQPIPIAFCITELDPGGAERALVELVSRLDRREWSPHVYCLSSRGVMADALDAAEIPVTCLGADAAWQVPGAIWSLARRLRKQRPMLLQTYLFHANLIGRVAGRLAGVPHIVSGIRVAERGERWHLRLDRWTNRLVDLNICVSRGVADFARDEGGLDPRKLAVIPNGVAAERFANVEPADLSEFRIPSGSRTLITVGRLHPQKGLHDLLDAAEELLPQFPDLHLLLVGSGLQEQELRSRVERTGRAGRIHFAGWRSDVPALLAASDLFVLASHWEGMPNVLLEAMAAGLPVVTTRVEGTAELIEPGVTGWTVSLRSPVELKDVLVRLLSDPEIGREVGLRSQAIVRQRFTWDSVVADALEIYRACLSSGPKTHSRPSCDTCPKNF